MIVIGPIALLILVLILAISTSWTNFVGAPWVPTTMDGEEDVEAD
jgi:hypothetical protein